MKRFLAARPLVALLMCSILAACGGGGTSTGGSQTSSSSQVVASSATDGQTLAYPIPSNLWSAPSDATPVSGNYVYLQSDSGDYIGGGRTNVYTNADTQIAMSSSGLTINATVNGNQRWSGGFLLPKAAGTLQAGYFTDLTRTPFADPAVGGVEWSGEGRGCNTIKGWVVIDKVVQVNGALESLDLRFEQHCEGGTAALHGQIHWNKADATAGQPTGPAPIPADLWRAGAGTVPATGNYMYLESTPGDYIGAGRTYSYTPANSTIKLNPSAEYLGVSIAGNQNWSGDFKAMNGMTRLGVGYYGGLSRYPFNNPMLGGLSWSGEGRGCNTLSGWFVVDKATYNGTTLTELYLRFEQHCEGGSSALRGQLHWTSGEKPGPVNPPPAGLWKPSSSFVPPSGNYVYLVSDAGDYIGAGRTELFTPNNSTLNVTTNRTAALGISVGGWNGDFVGMTGLSQLQPGYYGDLQRYPFHDPAKGGLNWSGNGRGCNTLKGWFVVDSVSYSLGQLTAIDLRFEQHCEGNVAAQRGVIHWTAGNKPGPVNPPPAGLWKPSSSFVPPNGNYVYLVSDAGDYIGAGRTELFTPNNSTLNVNTNLTAALGVNVGGWNGNFVGMTGLSQLQPGYYGDLQRYPFHDATKGGLNWSGNGRGCNTLRGWFVVDSVSYSMGQLTAIDLRFEQHCEGNVAAQRGVIHWTK
ncbi:hypothetical protein [Pseudoduganella violaceinigra]|uniref:hypothetical protein n=1 Tax=Pseudoduganella violaceinigra TaxID=246602 RepID=UPI0012B66F87|nr:hypothetical protein [Pseudoduganella violaceinigra]